MGDQNDLRPGLTRGVGDQPVAGDAGGGLGARGPGGAVGIQAVIDGQGQQAAAVSPGPVGGDLQQGDGVPATGQGDPEGARRSGEQASGQAAVGPGDPVRVGPVQPGLRAGGRAGVAGARAGVQAKRVPISVARVRWAAVAVAA
jgi:hypothetical protein